MPPLQTPPMQGGGMPTGIMTNNNNNTMLTMTESEVPPQKEKKNMLIYAICGGVALLGMILALVFFVDSNNKANEIKKLKKQITSGEDVVIDGETIATGARTKNPVLSATYPQVYNIDYTSKSYDLSDGANYSFSFSIRDGKVFSCDARKITSGDSYGEDNKQCSVNNVSGNIYKVIDILDDSDSQNDLLAFLLEDGTVDFVKIYPGLKNMQFNVLGKLDAGGFVTDAMHLKLFEKESVSGHTATVFTLSDGSFVQYKKSMLQFN